jgi:hypothetical protein
MAVLLKCPACREKFKYDVSQGWPDSCPICETDINNRVPDNVVVVPAFLSQKSKNIDGVARQVMDGSETRAGLAAAMAGVPVEEMSALKITDLNDRNDTEYAAKEIVNPVTQQMDMIRQRGGAIGFGNAEAQNFAAAAHADSFAPHAGAREMRRLQKIMSPIGQAPLPLEISNNPNYRSPV